MCDDIKMIEHGHLVFSGTLEEFDNYVKPDTFIVKLDNPPADEDILAIPGVTRFKHLDRNTLRVQFDKRDDITEVVADTCCASRLGIKRDYVGKNLFGRDFCPVVRKKIDR